MLQRSILPVLTLQQFLLSAVLQDGSELPGRYDPVSSYFFPASESTSSLIHGRGHPFPLVASSTELKTGPLSGMLLLQKTSHSRACPQWDVKSVGLVGLRVDFFLVF